MTIPNIFRLNLYIFFIKKTINNKIHKNEATRGKKI